MSSSFSQSALVRFSRGMLQKFFQISLLRESISAASASVTVPLAVLYIIFSFLRTCFFKRRCFIKVYLKLYFCAVFVKGCVCVFLNCLKVGVFSLNVVLLTL